MTGVVVVVAIAFLLLLWTVVALRRRSLRSYLLAVGAETPGTARLVRKSLRHRPRLLVSYTTADGVHRTIAKAQPSAGDEQLATRPVRVVYHPRRAGRDDYVIFGFGEHPVTWFRGNFTDSTG